MITFNLDYDLDLRNRISITQSGFKQIEINKRAIWSF